MFCFHANQQAIHAKINSAHKNKKGNMQIEWWPGQFLLDKRSLTLNACPFYPIPSHSILVQHTHTHTHITIKLPNAAQVQIKREGKKHAPLGCL